MPSTQARKRSRRAPHERLQLDHVPPSEEVTTVAEKARRAWGVSPTSCLDLPRLCERLGIEVSVLSMGVPEGGAQGFLIPTIEGRFRIEVDPEPASGWQSVAPGLQRTLARHRQRFLIAHELAHTLFYAGGPAGPQRLVLDSDQQETFCDDLARALLVPPAIARETPFTPDGVVELQRRFDVSMEVALRSAVTAHEGTTAWLLLIRRDELRVQWTTAERQLTTRALPDLRRLAARAVKEGRAQARLAGVEQTVRALYLAEREQAIVTANLPVPTGTVSRP
jgi:Zn-dependent peptidase ImmA (M78 family)